MKIIDVTITEKHLDAALALPWATCNCVAALAVAEVVGKEVKRCSPSGAASGKNWFTLSRGRTAQNISGTFDLLHAHGQRTRADVAALLPFTYQLELHENE